MPRFSEIIPFATRCLSMVTLAEKALFVRNATQSLPSFRIVCNGINVGRSNILLRNTVKARVLKDAQVQAAREYAVERLYALATSGVDLARLSGNRVQFENDEASSVAATEIIQDGGGVARKIGYEFHYWIQNYPRRFNFFSSLISYGGGDLLAQVILGKKINWGFVAGMALVGAYYSQETPFIYGKVADKIKADTFLGKAARMITTNFLLSISYFVPRHVAAVRFIAGEPFLGMGDIYTRALTVWLGMLPFTTPYDYIVNNYVPKKYKFLFIEMFNFVWSTIAAVVSLKKPTVF